MPGRTIGTKLEPPTEIVWEGTLTIIRNPDGYALATQRLRGDPMHDRALRMLLDYVERALADPANETDPISSGKKTNNHST